MPVDKRNTFRLYGTCSVFSSPFFRRWQQGGRCFLLRCSNENLYHDAHPQTPSLGRHGFHSCPRRGDRPDPIRTPPNHVRRNPLNEPTVKPHLPPVPPATPILSYSPVVLDMPGRPAPLELRVVAPAAGSDLPIIIFSHGHGGSNFLSSMRGYDPLVEFYASHGFVVLIPTHLNSKTLALDPNGPEGPLFWRSRPKDIQFILDQLDAIEATVPGLKGRLDKSRIAAVGHSLGGHSVAMLAGMTITDVSTGEAISFKEPRIKAAVMLSPPGDSADASDWLKEHYPALAAANDFSSATLPALVITGDEDFSDYFSARKDWRSDAYRLSPSPKSLLFLHGAGHMFGGVSGYDAKETSDESPERVATIQRFTWAYLRSNLYPGDTAWQTVAEAFGKDTNPAGRIENR